MGSVSPHCTLERFWGLTSNRFSLFVCMRVSTTLVVWSLGKCRTAFTAGAAVSLSCTVFALFFFFFLALLSRPVLFTFNARLNIKEVCYCTLERFWGLTSNDFSLFVCMRVSTTLVVWSLGKCRTAFTEGATVSLSCTIFALFFFFFLLFLALLSRPVLLFTFNARLNIEKKFVLTLMGCTVPTARSIIMSLWEHSQLIRRGYTFDRFTHTTNTKTTPTFFSVDGDFSSFDFFFPDL